MVSVIGRLKCLFEPPRTVTKSTPCTIPSLSACALVTLARGQSFLGASLQGRRTRSPFCTLRVMFVHFLRGCSVRRYSLLHRDQKTSARCWTRFHCLWQVFSTEFPSWRFQVLRLMSQQFRWGQNFIRLWIVGYWNERPGIDDSWYLSHQGC